MLRGSIRWISSDPTRLATEMVGSCAVNQRRQLGTFRENPNRYPSHERVLKLFVRTEATYKGPTRAVCCERRNVDRHFRKEKRWEGGPERLDEGLEEASAYVAGRRTYE
jgi:hypothetical protein